MIQYLLIDTALDDGRIAGRCRLRLWRCRRMLSDCARNHIFQGLGVLERLAYILSDLILLLLDDMITSWICQTGLDLFGCWLWGNFANRKIRMFVMFKSTFRVIGKNVEKLLEEFAAAHRVQCSAFQLYSTRLRRWMMPTDRDCGVFAQLLVGVVLAEAVVSTACEMVSKTFSGLGVCIGHEQKIKKSSKKCAEIWIFQ